MATKTKLSPLAVLLNDYAALRNGEAEGSEWRNDLVATVRRLEASHARLLAACKALLVVVDKLPNGHSAERVTSAIAGRAAVAEAEALAREATGPR